LRERVGAWRHTNNKLILIYRIQKNKTIINLKILQLHVRNREKKEILHIVMREREHVPTYRLCPIENQLP